MTKNYLMVNYVDFSHISLYFNHCNFSTQNKKTDMVVMQLSGKGKKINERRVRMRVKEKRDKKDKNISSIQLYFN